MLLNLQLEDNLAEELRQQADAEDRTVAGLAQRLVRAALRKRIARKQHQHRRNGRRQRALVVGMCLLAFVLGAALAWLVLRGAGANVSEKEPNPLAQNQPPAKAEPLRLTLDVNCWDSFRARDHAIGLIGSQVCHTEVGQRVVLNVELSEPGYCYLLAFNYDGKEQLLWPCKHEGAGDDALPPPRTTQVSYPPSVRGGNRALVLEEDDDKGGMQAFVVVSSRQPLPAYRVWRESRKASPWRRMDAFKEVWRSDGRTLDPMVPGMHAKRGQDNPRARTVTLVGQPPLLEVCRWALGTDVEKVEGIVFGVLAKEVR